MGYAKVAPLIDEDALEDGRHTDRARYALRGGRAAPRRIDASTDTGLDRLGPPAGGGADLGAEGYSARGLMRQAGLVRNVESCMS